MLKKILTISLVICGAAVYLHAQTPATQPAQQTHVTEGGVTCTTTDAGDWVTEKGDTVYVHYTGKLQSGEQFDSSIGKEPINIVLGAGRVIKGWEEGLLGMKLGEKRHLVIPPGLAYGERGAGGGKIPPNATLEFDVQIVGVIRGAR